ncbi:MAG: hypothetical protein FWE42_05690 [Defluviitaleaceae bacterium]|nr:hypothetical protein [Defluviitaleaceae bacterium]
MKKRTIAIKPAEILEIKLPDGSTKEAIFNMESLMVLAEEFGNPADLAQTFFDRPYEMCAQILYCGIKVMDSTITLDEANAIMVGGGEELMCAIMDLFQANMGPVDPEAIKKNLIPVMNRILLKQQKQKTQPEQKPKKKIWPWARMT